MAHKLKEGNQLWIDGKVEIIYFDGSMIQGRVIGSGENVYNVTCLDGYYRCDCPDWTNRWGNREGAYMCKHLEAFKFKIVQHLILVSLL